MHPDSVPRPRTPRADSRLQMLLDAAAAQFAVNGFRGTSIRDIVRAVGMLPGSLYYHFATKDDLLAAVYAEGVRRIDRAVANAVESQSEPWARIEAACIAHLESLLDRSPYAKVVVSIHPADAPGVATRLTELRDGYEQRFRTLIESVTPPPLCDRDTLRMLLLGALNWTPTWYRPEGITPREIARNYVRILMTALAK